jgi:hypothetical protein
MNFSPKKISFFSSTTHKKMLESFHEIHAREPEISFYKQSKIEAVVAAPPPRGRKKQQQPQQADSYLNTDLFISLFGANLPVIQSESSSASSSIFDAPAEQNTQRQQPRKRFFDASKYLSNQISFDEIEFSAPKKHKAAADIIVISDAEDDDDDYTSNTAASRAPRGTSRDPILIDDDDDTANDCYEVPAAAATDRKGLHSVMSENADVAQFLIQQGSLMETLGVLNTDSLFQFALDDLQQRESSELEIAIPTNLNAADKDWRYKTVDTNGDKMLAKLRQSADLFKKKRSFLQRKLHALAWNVCAGVIFGTEWYSNREGIMQRYGWKDLLPVAACICPRRYGKTVGTAMLAADFLLCMPGVRIACFAPTLRQAVNLMQAIVEEVQEHPWFQNFTVESRNQIDFKIRGTDGTVRQVTAYPSLHTVSVVCV